MENPKPKYKRPSKNRTQPIPVRFSEEELKEIDLYANELGTDRSAVLRMGVLLLTKKLLIAA